MTADGFSCPSQTSRDLRSQMTSFLSKSEKALHYQHLWEPQSDPRIWKEQKKDLILETTKCQTPEGEKNYFQFS